VGPDVFHALRASLGAGFECFASPLNTFFGRFCGAFPDVDAPFGSSGGEGSEHTPQHPQHVRLKSNVLNSSTKTPIKT
jgi:hypothetical protein